MPKVDIDYSNTIIYKITCNDEKINHSYVGYTTNFVQRKYAHKMSCINTKSSNYKCKLYEVIRNNGGWDNWKMEIINFFNCKDHYEARKKEQEYFLLLKATLNSTEPMPLLKPSKVTLNSQETKVVYCTVCNIHFNTEKLLELHNGTQKHKSKINNQLLEKNSKKTPKFVCDMCDFKCFKQNEYTRHINTNKHKMVINGNKKTPDDEPCDFTCVCGNSYKYNPGLIRHKRTCLVVNNRMSKSLTNDNIDHVVLDDKIVDKVEENIEYKTDNELKQLVKELIKHNGELVKTINDIVPKIGNTNITNNNNNNSFNLNIFLNEKCKDALNISDFIGSLEITLEDLLFSKTNGISRGITDVMIKGLKELDIHKRPIHCTDIKREIMYIKDEDKWQKDDNHDMLKNTIIKIADKERTALQQWAIDNPDWIETERKQLDYLTMVRSVCEPIEKYSNYEKKIIKNLGKEIQIDKKV
jgi:hypothetical protein